VGGDHWGIELRDRMTNPINTAIRRRNCHRRCGLDNILAAIWVPGPEFRGADGTTGRVWVV